LLAPIDALVAYVPNLIAQYLAAEGTPLGNSACESLSATMLSTNTIGLTVLPERLTQLLNVHVGHLIGASTDVTA
jgi:hypothetical protein